MAVRVAVGVALILASVSTAHAQVDDVALVALGSGRASAATAFQTFVPIPEASYFEEAPDEPPTSIELMVTIDTDADVVRVWRRRDGIVLERRFEASDDDGYAIALVASELLEVARTGADPASVGATVVEEAAVVEPEVPAQESAETEAVVEESVESPSETPATVVVSFTPGLGVEGWFSIDGDPWIVQPTLFLELLAGPSNEAWRIGGALFSSALGGYGRREGDVDGSYARHDFGARLSVGGDVGPIGTRLLGHGRIGASAIVGSAREEGNDDQPAATRAGWFVGLGLDVRQPLVEGLELFLDLSADFFPSPVRFTAFGDTLIREPPARLAGRLGIAWRIQ